MKRRVCATSLLLLCCCVHAVHQEPSSHTRTAVAGHPTVLPCPTSPLDPPDPHLAFPHASHLASPLASHHLILVFKDGQSSPIYSWDTRVKSHPDSDSCSRCPSKQLEGRSYFYSLDSDSGSSSSGDSAIQKLMSDWQNHVFQANFVAGLTKPQNGSENITPGHTDPRADATESWIPQETGLVLNPVRLSDAGDYICRVDFPNSPTRNTFVQLRVVEPMTSISVRGFITSSSDVPQAAFNKTEETNTTNSEQFFPSSMIKHSDNLSQPKTINKEAMDDSMQLPNSSNNKRSLKSEGDQNSYRKQENLPKRSLASTSLYSPKVLGPYPVGTDLLLQCEVIHGSPSPTLRWEDDEGSLVASSAMTAGLRRSSISYRLANISLASIGSFITCVAQNSPLTPVMRESVIIDVGVPPSSIKILADETDHQSPATDSAQPAMLTSGDFAHPSTMTALKTSLHARANWTVLTESSSIGDPRFPSGGDTYGPAGKDTYAPAGKDTHSRPEGDILASSKGIPYGDTHIPSFKVTEGIEFLLVCEGAASRPPATLLWTRGDGEPLSPHLVKVTHLPGSPTSLTLTRSTLHMRASASLHGVVLQCSVSAGSAQQQSALTAAVQLSINYAPKISLSTNSTLPAVEENSSIVFHCHVNARPPPHGSILLYKNDDVIHEWATSGTSNETKTVTVTVAGAEWSGYYSCAARNLVGSATSQPLHVRVNYAPRCAGAPHTSYSSRGGVSILVTCAVVSQPRPSGFRWYVVPQNGSVPVEVTSHKEHGRSSTLEYSVPLYPPYPQLHCLASNDVGDMLVPCVINILPAAEPDSVQTCRAGPADDEDSSISVVCEPGRDGGLNQSFTLEVRPTRNPLARPPKALYLSSTPSFMVGGLFPAEEYTFTVTASNARGLSSPYILTYVVPLEKIQAFPSVILHEEITPVLLIAFGAMAAVITCSVGALLARGFFVRNKNGKVQHRRDHSGFPSSTSDYRRLHQYNTGSLVRGSGKSTMLTSCVRPSAGTSRSCFSADASSCGEDSLSRSSCRSATDTLLWTLSSDSESNRTFRNSGCYHIANLTPPECSAMPQSPHTGDRRHQILVTEIHAPDTPRSTSSRFSVPSCYTDKSADNSSPCECSSHASHSNTYACSSPSYHPKRRPNQSPCGHSCAGSRSATSSLSRKSRLSSPEFPGLLPGQCSYRRESQARCQADFDITGPCPEVEALLTLENSSENRVGERTSKNDEVCSCNPKENFAEHERLYAKLHKTAVGDDVAQYHFAQKCDAQKLSAISNESEGQSNYNDSRTGPIDSEDANVVEKNTLDSLTSSCTSGVVEETSLNLLTVPYTCDAVAETSLDLLAVSMSDASSDHSSRPSSSVSIATVALNPNYDPDQQLSESDS
ncbi:CD80-like immunoglobulin C2-set [Trinorchestia longiramus]|nr:CD80-like immunoglobulin C2-set [Trinorchestia longiramus]